MRSEAPTKAVERRKLEPERQKTALEAARGPYSEHFTQEESKIEPGDVDQQPLADVLVATEVGSS